MARAFSSMAQQKDEFLVMGTWLGFVEGTSCEETVKVPARTMYTALIENSLVRVPLDKHFAVPAFFFRWSISRLLHKFVIPYD